MEGLLGPPADLVPVAEGQRTMEVLWGGLNKTMRAFLVARSGAGTDVEAAGVVGTSSVQISQWKAERPDFAAAYTILLTSPVLFAQAHIKSLAPKLVGVLEDALSADALVVSGRDSDGGTKYEKMPAYQVRLRAVELGLRANGMLSTDVNITKKTLSYEEKLIRHRIENGMAVPEHVLREMGETE